MLDPFDKTRCSFAVPDFKSDEEELNWERSLSGEQRLELLHLTQIARWGEARVNAPMDRTKLEIMTMKQFCRMKEREDAAEERWRKKHGWPPRLVKACGPRRKKPAQS